MCGCTQQNQTIFPVNISNIELERKPSGDPIRIGKDGAADVYRARMKKRDDDDIIEGEYLDVAVKEIIVPRSSAAARLPQFMREAFLQKNAQHPCIVQTFGGYWPDMEEAGEYDDIEPWIVMERMTCNLDVALSKKLLESPDSKRRILCDVAEGIERLHSCGIVHRDIKPENVLMRIVNGEIIGQAKVCDFGVSRNAQATSTVTINAYTGINGTKFYMPAEAFSKSAQKGNMHSRDIWSFGVVMCVVFQPNFLKNTVSRDPEGLDVSTMTGQFAKEVAETARTISCDIISLQDLAASCLVLDHKMRPKIGDVLRILKQPDGGRIHTDTKKDE